MISKMFIVKEIKIQTRKKQACINLVYIILKKKKMIAYSMKDYVV